MELRNIIIRTGVVMNDYVNKFLELLDVKLVENGIHALIVGCTRAKYKQLAIIVDKAHLHKLIPDNETLSMTERTDWEGHNVPDWQPAWEQLIEMGYLIAPLSHVTILTGSRAGQERNPSDHFENENGQVKALDFDSILPDIKGNETQRETDREKIFDTIDTIGKENPDLIRQLLFEKLQECVHIGLY